jgi:hypothetical protein
MARSTGPIIATGAITVVNRSVLNDKPVDWPIILATGIAAGALALLEKGWEGVAVGLSWLVLITSLFAKIDPTVPAPAESLLKVIS